MLKSKSLHVSEETKASVRKYFGVTEEEVKEKVKILKEWVQKEAHLPDNPDETFLERRLLKNKFRIEGTKEILEKYYTFKALIADHFTNVNVLLPSQTFHLLVALPVLTKDLERIIIIKVKTKNEFNEDSIMEFFKYLVYASEFFLAVDYSVGHRIIQDFEGFSFEHFKAYLGVSSSYWPLYQEAYKSSTRGVEYINVPYFLDALMQAGKKFLKAKTFEKITIHQSLESLHKSVPKEYLPLEYGGDQMSIDEYVKLWDEDFKSNIDKLPSVLQECSRENLRVGDAKVNEQFGLKGTFRSLNVD